MAEVRRDAAVGFLDDELDYLQGDFEASYLAGENDIFERTLTPTGRVIRENELNDLVGLEVGDEEYGSYLAARGQIRQAKVRRTRQALGTESYGRTGGEGGTARDVIRSNYQEALREAQETIDLGKNYQRIADEAEEMRRRNEARAANASFLGTTLGIGGAIVGGTIGGPGGAAIGAQVGGGLGQTLGAES